MSDTQPYQRARAAALRFLSHRPRSASEIRARLLRSYPGPVVEQVLLNLEEQDLVNDARFADQWVTSRISHRPRSSWVLKRELMAKGVDPTVAEGAALSSDDEQSAYRAGLQHTRRLSEADFNSFRRRLWGYLKRRGFSDSLTRQTINRLWDEQPDESRGNTSSPGNL